MSRLSKQTRERLREIVRREVERKRAGQKPSENLESDLREVQIRALKDRAADACRITPPFLGSLERTIERIGEKWADEYLDGEIEDGSEFE